jgi:hypothetical protein
MTTPVDEAGNSDIIVKFQYGPTSGSCVTPGD